EGESVDADQDDLRGPLVVQSGRRPGQAGERRPEAYHGPQVGHKMRLLCPPAPPRFRLASVVALGVCFLTLSQAQEPAAQASREERWRQDLKFFADEFPRRHVDFARLYHQPAFDRELAELQAGVLKLSDAEITMRLMRLVASAGVAH